MSDRTVTRTEARTYSAGRQARAKIERHQNGTIESVWVDSLYFKLDHGNLDVCPIQEAREDITALMDLLAALREDLYEEM